MTAAILRMMGIDDGMIAGFATMAEDVKKTVAEINTKLEQQQQMLRQLDLKMTAVERYLFDSSLPYTVLVNGEEYKWTA